MKLLFCHDGPIEKINNDYFGIGFNDELFDRYKVIADEIYIAMRVHINYYKNIDKTKYLKLSKEYKVVECPNISSLRGQIFFKKSCKKILENAIKSVDLIIIRLPSIIGNIAVDICKKNKKKFFIEMVGCPWDALWNHSFKGKLIAPFLYLQTKKSIKDAEYVQYVTNVFLQKRYPTKGKSIGCSDVKILEESNKKEYCEKDLKKEITVGTIGNIDIKYKGQKYVIKAIKRLKEKGINFRYELVGAGNKKELYEFAKKLNVLDNITFLGVMKHNDIFKWLEKIDIYIQPSTTEGMPRSMIEAMSAGCLCISSNAGGMPELLNERFVFKKKKYKQLVEILMSIENKDFEEQCNINYKNSLNFSEKILTEKRNKFLEEYKKNID